MPPKQLPAVPPEVPTEIDGCLPPETGGCLPSFHGAAVFTSSVILDAPQFPISSNQLAVFIACVCRCRWMLPHWIPIFVQLPTAISVGEERLLLELSLVVPASVFIPRSCRFYSSRYWMVTPAAPTSPTICSMDFNGLDRLADELDHVFETGCLFYKPLSCPSRET